LLITVWDRFEAAELDLLRWKIAERVEIPVVERAMVLVLQGAEGMRHALDGIGLAVAQSYMDRCSTRHRCAGGGLAESGT